MEQPATRTVVTRLGPLQVHTEGSGPPAVLWHSLFVDSRTWNRVRQPLAEQRTLLLIDGPGHGGSAPVRRRFRLHDCVGAAIDILDHLGIREPVDWLGNAWGGHVGILFAAEHPDRCRSLLAIGTPVHALKSADRRDIALLSVVYRVVGPRPRLLVNMLVDGLLGPRARTADPEGAGIVADAFRRADRGGMYWAVRSVSLGRPDLTGALDRIGTPTLLTTGDDDPMWTLADARSAAAHLTRGGLVVLPGAAHIGPLLQTGPEVVELVTAFWRDPEATIRRRAVASAPRPRAV